MQKQQRSRSETGSLAWVFAALSALATNNAFAQAANPPSSDLAAQLSAADAELNQAYKAAIEKKDEAGRKALRDEQRAWIKRRDAECKLDFKAPDHEQWMQSMLRDTEKADCTVKLTQERVAELKGGRSETKNEASASSASSPSKPRYRIIQGKGYTVCEAFLKNLNAFPPDEPPMVCEQKIHPTHPEFSRPTWEEMDVQSNLKLIYEVEGLHWRFRSIDAKPFEEWEKHYQERIKTGEAKPRLRKTVLDLNGSGPETLIWYEYLIGKCADDLKEFKNTSTGPGGFIVVLRAATGKLEKFTGLIVSAKQTDVLLYRGRKVLFTHALSDAELLKSGYRLKWHIGLSPVAPKLYYGEYVVPGQCGYWTDP